MLRPFGAHVYYKDASPSQAWQATLDWLKGKGWSAKVRGAPISRDVPPELEFTDAKGARLTVGINKTENGTHGFFYLTPHE